MRGTAAVRAGTAGVDRVFLAQDDDRGVVLDRLGRRIQVVNREQHGVAVGVALLRGTPGAMLAATLCRARPWRAVRANAVAQVSVGGPVITCDAIRSEDGVQGVEDCGD